MDTILLLGGVEMIKKAVIVNTPTSETPDEQYLNVEFTDGSFVNLDEEELKYASLLKAIKRENKDE